MRTNMIIHIDNLRCFFFKDTATTEIYTYRHTLSLHDARPICRCRARARRAAATTLRCWIRKRSASRQATSAATSERSEEHTSELQSLTRISYAVFCLKKKTQKRISKSTGFKNLKSHNKLTT